MDKRAAVVLSVIFGGFFAVLLAFLFLSWSALRGPQAASDDSAASVTSGSRVAVVDCRGAIGEGGDKGVDGDKTVQELEKLRKDDGVKAIVLRVDSPGGAVGPSQEIYGEIRKIRTQKKVVAAMGSIAASGGYYISAATDWIVAEPGTLTGSIGVIFMHFNVRGLLEQVHIEETTLKSGRFKDTLSPFRPVSDDDRSEIQSVSDDVYAQFVHDVAQGRNMKDEEVRKVAEGRIYTGRQAKELHLVDQLGGLPDAIAKAWSLAGESGEPRVQLPGHPGPFSLRDLMRGAFEGAGAGVVEGAKGAAVHAGHAGPMLIAPSLVE